MIKLKQMKLDTIQKEKQLKFQAIVKELDKYEYLTGEDLGCKLQLNKQNLNILNWVRL